MRASEPELLAGEPRRRRARCQRTLDRDDARPALLARSATPSSSPASPQGSSGSTPTDAGRPDGGQPRPVRERPGTAIATCRQSWPATRTTTLARRPPQTRDSDVRCPHRSTRLSSSSSSARSTRPTSARAPSCAAPSGSRTASSARPPSFQRVGKGAAATKARHGMVPVMNVDHSVGRGAAGRLLRRRVDRQARRAQDQHRRAAGAGARRRLRAGAQDRRADRRGPRWRPRRPSATAPPA